SSSSPSTAPPFNSCTLFCLYLGRSSITYDLPSSPRRSPAHSARPWPRPLSRCGETHQLHDRGSRILPLPPPSSPSSFLLLPLPPPSSFFLSLPPLPSLSSLSLPHLL